MKYKPGDKVKCVDTDIIHYKGAGWIPNKIFIIDNCSSESNPNKGVYFPQSGAGVYEPALELVNNWKTRLQ